MQTLVDWASWQMVKNTPAKSNTLNDRADRLKYVKKNALACQRDLKRDRTSLDRAEKSLVSILINIIDDTTKKFC
jgi:uncharacterized protein YktB (UPF0637 family)